MNELFAVHYKGKLIDRSNSSDYGHSRKGKVYTSVGPAKAFVTRLRTYFKQIKKEQEIENYTIVRYVPEMNGEK
jgi:hypothetical protein